MPEYKYVVADARGKKIEGKLTADNEEACRRIFQQRGLYCLHLAPVSVLSMDLGGGGKFDLKALCVFCRQFAAMLTSGISIIKILDILQGQAEDKSKKKLIKAVFDSVQKGNALSKSFADQGNAFPEMMINMIEAGENSGTLDRVMGKISDHYDKSLKTNNKVKSAMMYPIILGVITILVVAMLLIFVVPTFTKMFESSGTELPLPTKILTGLSSSLKTYWFVYFGVIAAFVIGFMLIKRNPNGVLMLDKMKTRMPIVGKLNVIVVSARFARTLSTMLSSGIALVRSLEITAKTMNNKYYEKYVNEVTDEIKKGNPLSATLMKDNMFPTMLVSMISVGEESGAIDDVLEKTAAFYDEESDAATSRLVGLLEPIMIVVMAIVIGFVVAAIMLPMMTMGKTVQ